MTAELASRGPRASSVQHDIPLVEVGEQHNANWFIVSQAGLARRLCPCTTPPRLCTLVAPVLR
jgi:hypothetical protein